VGGICPFARATVHESCGPRRTRASAFHRWCRPLIVASPAAPRFGVAPNSRPHGACRTRDKDGSPAVNPERWQAGDCASNQLAWTRRPAPGAGLSVRQYRVSRLSHHVEPPPILGNSDRGTRDARRRSHALEQPRFLSAIRWSS